MKILFYDGTGLCLFYKRLDAGFFRLPARAEGNVAGAVAIDEDDLNALLDGIDLERPQRRQRVTPMKKRRRILN